MITATANDIKAAVKKRLSTQAHFLTEGQLDTLVVDIMNVINTDSASAVSHAATESTQNPARVFLRHV